MIHNFVVGQWVRQIEPSNFSEHDFPGVNMIEEITPVTIRFVGSSMWNIPSRFELVRDAADIPNGSLTSKDTNPKDAVGTKKWRIFTTVPMTVIAEIGVAMLEGARKYGRHNYRIAGVRSSVYVDAAYGHLLQWWEGEDTDPDSGLSHITKAIASLVVMRDSMIQGNMVDDRPPVGNLGKVRENLQNVVDGIFERHPTSAPAYTQADREWVVHTATGAIGVEGKVGQYGTGRSYLD